MDKYRDKRIIFFDGVCNLCNGSVQLVLRNDTREKFLFAPLQSAASIAFISERKEDHGKLDSIVLFDKGRIYERSTAALRIALRMRGLFPLLAIFLIVPVFIRDGVYNWIGRNRYRWFGKGESCMIPGPDTQKRFIFMDEVSVF